MPNQFRVTCPTCETSFTQDRCGIRELKDEEQAHISVKCMVCDSDFDVSVKNEPLVVETGRPGWFGRVVLRRKPTFETKLERVVNSALRG